MAWVETIVFGEKGIGARLRRMLRARQEYKRRQPGCIGAWMNQVPNQTPCCLSNLRFTQLRIGNAFHKKFNHRWTLTTAALKGFSSARPWLGFSKYPTMSIQSMRFDSIG